jgi:uncharacterized protein
VKRLLIDTGPLVALLNRRDRYHTWARRTFDAVEPPIFTCEAVLSEVCFLLGGAPGGPDAVLGLVDAGVIKVDFRLDQEAAALSALMKKFADVPMSLADACLVRMTEIEVQSTVVTLDSDFRVYRRNRRQAVPTLMPKP